MSRLVDRALAASKESGGIDFKAEADFSAPHTWCELVKDVVAVTNSGGGAIVVGLDDSGQPSGTNVQPVLDLDPAVVTDKVYKYTGVHFDQFQITAHIKCSHKVAVVEIGATDVPVPFSEPGTYMVDGKHKNAFARGTTYFRHGAKSEPGTYRDFQRFIDRRVKSAQRSLMAGVKKLVAAPPGSEVVAIKPGYEVVATTSTDALPVRLTTDPKAPGVHGIDHDVTHPYRQKELIDRVNALARSASVNSYDVQSIRKVHDACKEERFCHHPKYSSPQYSDAFVDWIVEQIHNDPDYVKNARHAARAMRRGRVTTEAVGDAEDS